MNFENNVLDVHDLGINLLTGEAIVEEVAFHLQPGEILGLVGESGSGKTTAALALFGYVQPGLGIASGSLSLGGDVFSGPSVFRGARGRLIAYVPQSPARLSIRRFEWARQ